MNHYQVLEIELTASQSDIKLAYRKLVKRYHPDINPSEEAKMKIRLVNEAYEILSNPTSRNLYDLYLQGVPVKTVLDEVTPQQRYKAEYLRKRKQQERERMEQMIHYKQKFYRYFRVVNVMCFLASLLYSFDYYVDSSVYTIPVWDVTESRYSTMIEFNNNQNLHTSKSFYGTYTKSGAAEVNLYISSVFEIPKNVRVKGGNRDFLIKGNLYVFRNFFSIILFVFSIIVVGNKFYSDFRLTCGLISCMTMLWLVLLVFSTFNKIQFDLSAVHPSFVSFLDLVGR